MEIGEGSAYVSKSKSSCFVSDQSGAQYNAIDISKNQDNKPFGTIEMTLV